eukprot:756942-Hanusia_phi.AAC.2
MMQIAAVQRILSETVARAFNKGSMENEVKKEEQIIDQIEDLTKRRLNRLSHENALTRGEKRRSGYQSGLRFFCFVLLSIAEASPNQQAKSKSLNAEISSGEEKRPTRKRAQ